MKKSLLSVSLLLTASVAIAASDQMRTITLPLAAQTWATSNTANVTLSVDASSNNLQMSALQTEMQKKLTQIANADWHITQVNRGQSQSGLVEVNWQVQARVPVDAVATVDANVKKMSVSGLQFNLMSTDYSPSFAEMQQAQMNLHTAIYAEAEQAMAQANKSFSGAHYQISQITFINSVNPIIVPLMAQVAMAKQAAPTMPLGRQVTQTATLVLAAK